MKRKIALYLSLMSLLVLGCRKDSPTQKLLDGLPLTVAPLSVAPAQAIQQYLLLKNATLSTVIINLNRLNAPNFPPQGLSGPDGTLSYTATKTESHFGTATLTLQFRDGTNMPIDPFSVRSSSAQVASVHIAVNATSPQFTITEDLTLTLNQVAILTGPYTMLGTSIFSGSSYSINFAIPAAVVAATDGLINGNATASGTGPSQPLSSSLVFGTDADINGVLTWEGQQAGIHVSRNGSGYLTTSDSRILFQ